MRRMWRTHHHRRLRVCTRPSKIYRKNYFAFGKSNLTWHHQHQQLGLSSGASVVCLLSPAISLWPLHRQSEQRAHTTINSPWRLCRPIVRFATSDATWRTRWRTATNHHRPAVHHMGRCFSDFFLLMIGRARAATTSDTKSSATSTSTTPVNTKTQKKYLLNYLPLARLFAASESTGLFQEVLFGAVSGERNNHQHTAAARTHRVRAGAKQTGRQCAVQLHRQLHRHQTQSARAGTERLWGVWKQQKKKIGWESRNVWRGVEQ